MCRRKLQTMRHARKAGRMPMTGRQDVIMIREMDIVIEEDIIEVVDETEAIEIEAVEEADLVETEISKGSHIMSSKFN
jgi:hypothetical protein